MKFAWLVLIVFASRFLSTAIAFPQVDGDLSWQRWLGSVVARSGIPRTLGAESWAAAGSPWTPQEWLFSLGANASRHGWQWDIFAGFNALCAVFALAVACRVAVRRGASERAVAVCAIFAGFALFESFGVRVQVVAWPILALFLAFLDVEGPAAYVAVLLAAIWSNVHASAMLAPVIASLAAAADVADPKAGFATKRRSIAIAALCFGAVCCNPLGWDLPIYAVSLFGSPIKGYINEWAPPNITDSSFALGALPLLLIAIAAFAGGDRARYRDTAILAAFAALMFFAGRNIAVFGLVGLSYAAPAMTRAWRVFAPQPPPDDLKRDRLMYGGVLAFATVAALAVSFGLARSEERTEDTVGARAIAAVEAMPGPRKLYCADFAWCSLAVGAPNVSVFLDGRADPYPLAIWKDFVAVDRGAPNWREVVDRNHVDTIMVRSDGALEGVLEGASGWHAAYTDKHFRIWLRG